MHVSALKIVRLYNK